MSATQEEGEREEEGESGKKVGNNVRHLQICWKYHNNGLLFQGISEAQAADTSLKTTVKSRKRAADEGFSEVNRKRSVPVSYSFQYCFSNIWFQLLKGDFQDTYEGTGSSTASVPVPRNLPDEKTTKEIPLHQLDTFSLLDFIEDFVRCGTLWSTVVILTLARLICRQINADRWQDYFFYSIVSAFPLSQFRFSGKIGKYKEIFNDPRMKGEEVLKHYEKRGYREFELPYMALLNGEMEEHEKSLSKIVKWVN